MTSHDMADIEKLCPRVILIDKGAIVYDGLLAEIRRAYSRECTVVVELARDPGCIDPPFGAIVRDDGLKKTVRFARTEGKAVDLITWLGTRFEIADVRILEPEIADVIRDIYEQGLDTAIGTR